MCGRERLAEETLCSECNRSDKEVNFIRDRTHTCCGDLGAGMSRGERDRWEFNDVSMNLDGCPQSGIHRETAET